MSRLRRLKTLIDRGVPTREAAQLCQPGNTTQPDSAGFPSPADIENAAAVSGAEPLAEQLADLLNAVGAIHTWQEVVAPALRGIGERWQRHGDCIDIEWVLTEAVTFAFEKYRRDLQPPAATPAVLLASCPGERHILPLRVLTAVLAENGIHAALLGEGAPASNIRIAAGRLKTTVTVLWSLMPHTADPGLADSLTENHLVLCAGPGWPTVNHREIGSTGYLAQLTETLVHLTTQHHAAPQRRVR